ncbi:MAG: DUF1080 domain-containing protein [Gemmatimonadetes bacterium]|nr:DUF1080 domain-containing protein [Gemmatimonadota bacterium]
MRVQRRAAPRILAALLLVLVPACAPASPGASLDGGSSWTSLFDGRTLNGWEGGGGLFRVEDGAIVGGTTTARVVRNEFLCREQEVADFVLKLQFRVGPGVNSGVQIRSQRISGSHETIGYQADLGDGYWGAIYDESRRNRVLARPDSSLISRILNREGWNRYEIAAEGPRIRLWINGQQTVDYTEPDPTVAQNGRICLQIHSGPPGEAWFRNIEIRRPPPGGAGPGRE